jgi:hypothetical protein
MKSAIGFVVAVVSLLDFRIRGHALKAEFVLTPNACER